MKNTRNKMVPAYNAKMEIVQAKRTDCRRIKGEFYIKGKTRVKNSGSCYYVDGRWYRISTGYLVYEESTRKYVLKNKHRLYKMVTKLPTEGNETEFGYVFSNFRTNSVKLRINGGVYDCYDLSIRDNDDFVEDLSTGIFHYIDNLTADQVKRIKNIRTVDRNYTRQYSYTVDNSLGNYINTSKGYISITQPSSEINRLFEPILTDEEYGGYTFGVEFETSRGIVPQYICERLGLIPLRDGSVGGMEYATVPYSGVKGVQNLVEACHELDKRTKTDSNCSLHIHVGGIPRTESYILALFKFLAMIEDDMYDMFPSYKRKNRGYKRKNYTSPLPGLSLFNSMKGDVKHDFGVLYKYLSQGYDYPGSLDNIDHHPSDPSGNRKWQIGTRYHWVNLIPIIFGNHKTVEFRVHTGTNNADKVISYLGLCLSIVDYVKRNETFINDHGFNSNVNLDTACYYSDNYPFNDFINRYVNHRKYFINNYLEDGVINPQESGFNFDSDDITDSIISYRDNLYLPEIDVETAVEEALEIAEQVVSEIDTPALSSSTQPLVEEAAINTDIWSENATFGTFVSGTDPLLEESSINTFRNTPTAWVIRDGEPMLSYEDRSDRYSDYNNLRRLYLNTSSQVTRQGALNRMINDFPEYSNHTTAAMAEMADNNGTEI